MSVEVDPLPGGVLHMRHSFASNLLMAGVSDVLVARWLGHSDTSMVQKRYGHLLAYHSDIDRMRLGQNEDQ